MHGTNGRRECSFCPTTMTLPEAFLEECFGYAAETIGKEDGAYIHGINMEGPFISHAKKGAQAGEHIVAPDYEMLCRLNKICPVKLVDIAPERKGAEEFIKNAKKPMTDDVYRYCLVDFIISPCFSVMYILYNNTP